MVVSHGSLPRPAARHAVTVGNFDGVHLGHRAMLERLVAKARALGVPACVLTFEPHPREFFAPRTAPARLTRLREKLELIAESGAERVHVLRFDARLASLAPERFVADVLVAGLGVRWLLVGRDFRYGAKRAGDYTALEAESARHGFELEAMPDVALEGARVWQWGWNYLTWNRGARLITGEARPRWSEPPPKVLSRVGVGSSGLFGVSVLKHPRALRALRNCARAPQTGPMTRHPPVLNLSVVPIPERRPKFGG